MSWFKKLKLWQKIVICLFIFGAISGIMRMMGFVKITISEIKVDDISLKVGESKEVKTIISPDDYEVKIISQEYEIDDEKIAKYKDGKVIALSEGETTIRCIIKDDTDDTIKSNKATIKVELTDEQKKQKEEAEKIAKRNSLSTNEGTRIKDYCKQIIDSILKAPSTAKYPGSFLNPFDDWAMVKKNNIVTVSSYVDAQNSFGAMVRSKFVIQVKMDDNGSGKATYVEFDGEVMSGKYQK